MDEDTCMVKAALRIMRFYAHESCGWCIPCREGTTWLKKAADRFHEGHGNHAATSLIGDLSRTCCWAAAALPTFEARWARRTVRWAAPPADHFHRGEIPDEFEAHLNGEPCPYEKSGRRLVTA
jgi:NADH-quinone oxidoreductase subunit F